MKLKHWRYNHLDLATQCEYVEDTNMSVLANSVELLNTRLLACLSRDARLLEIGCGAYSRLKKNMEPPTIWEGIDVIDFDRQGKPSVATRLASVEDIPWPVGSFDYVVSNQSIEHWYEYGVDFMSGLTEIRRVLEDSGKVFINFPVHLHGHRFFVTGDFEAIDQEFSKAGFDIQSRVAVIKSTIPPYRGWRLCGFPNFLVKRSQRHEATSYVVEYVLCKSTASSLCAYKRTESIKKPKLNVFQRQLHYGLRYIVWKVVARFLGRDRAQMNACG